MPRNKVFLVVSNLFLATLSNANEDRFDAYDLLIISEFIIFIDWHHYQ